MKPLGATRRTPPTTDMSVTTPPNCGVKPPGMSSWNEKQFSSANTRASAAWSGTLSVTVTVGQSAEPMPCACRTSAMSSVSPPSRL